MGRPTERERAARRDQEQGDPGQALGALAATVMATTVATNDSGATSDQPRPPNLQQHQALAAARQSA